MTEHRDVPETEVLFVERRPKRQEIFFQYFGNRGFRPTFLSSTTDAIERLKLDPPDAVVFTGDLPNTELFKVFLTVRQLTNETPLVAVFEFSLQQMELCDDLQPTPMCRITEGPLVLRDVRRQLHLGLKAR